MQTYSPEGCKIIIDGVQLELLSDKFLETCSSRGFNVNLQFQSSSVKYLKNLIAGKSHKKVAVEIFTDISDENGHIDIMDFKGDYILHGWSFDLSADKLPAYRFNFAYNSPLYS